MDLEGHSDSQRYIVVIGGGLVMADRTGQVSIMKCSVADYLGELAHQVGSVHFFASAKVRQEYPPGTKPDRLIAIHCLRRPLVSGLVAKVWAYGQDLLEIIKFSRGAVATLEFHPAGGGWLTSLGLAVVGQRYVVYFGADPVKRWSILSLKGKCSLKAMLKRLHFRFSAHTAVLLADHILVRDADQVARLEPRLHGRVSLSKPISTLTSKIIEREDCCQHATVNLLFVGMLTRLKGTDDLLRALNLLSRDLRLEGRELHLSIVGGPIAHGVSSYGYTEVQLRTMVEALGISGRVRLTGFINDSKQLVRFYREADMFVLPSKAEGFPRVIDEALAFGLPIITTPLSGIRSVLTDGETALLVPPSNPRALAEAIVRIINDAELRRKLIRGATELARARLTESAAKQHARILLNAGQ